MYCTFSTCTALQWNGTKQTNNQQSMSFHFIILHIYVCARECVCQVEEEEEKRRRASEFVQVSSFGSSRDKSV